MSEEEMVDEDILLNQPDPLQVAEETWGEKWKRITEGLKCDKESGEYKYAILQIQRIFGPTSASSLVCLAVLLMLIIFVATKPNVQPPALDVQIVDPEVEELEEIEEEPPEEIEEVTEVEEFEPAQDQHETDSEALVTEVPSFGDDTTEELVDMAVDIIKSPMVLKGLYGSRVGGGKANAIGKYGKRGGGALTAVLKALRWLKAHQEEDGSWIGKGESDKSGMTGLALLCYLAHGETPASKEFGTTVEKAIRYLLYAQEENGRFKNCGGHYSYGHAIATYALAESLTMTKMSLLKEPVEKAIEVIIQGQQGGGAWDYDYKKGNRKDMSVTAWQVQALKAASMAGAGNEGLPDALYKAVDGVKSFYGGGFGYTSAGKRKTLNGAGVLCLQLLGEAGSAEVKGGLAANANELPSWGKDGYGTYGWYYTTQARFQNGGELWKSWNDAMLPMMVKNQEADGHWTSGTTHHANDVYDTTLCCLCLEVYYRYLPTYEKADGAGGGAAAPKRKADPDEVKVNVGAVDLAL